MKDGKFEGLNYKYLEEDFEVSEGEIEIERVGRPQKWENQLKFIRPGWNYWTKTW